MTEGINRARPNLPDFEPMKITGGEHLPCHPAATQGLVCRACGDADASVVKDSRPTGNGVRRRRLCACGHRFTTVEVVAPDSQDAGLLVRQRPGYRGTSVTIEHLVIGAHVEAPDCERMKLAARIATAVNQVLDLA